MRETFCLDVREQAVRGRAADIPYTERVDRFLNELAEAPRIIERVPQGRREELITNFRGIQTAAAIEASQVAVRYLDSAGSQKSGRSADEKGCTLKSREQAHRERETRKKRKLQRNGS